MATLGDWLGPSDEFVWLQAGLAGVVGDVAADGLRRGFAGLGAQAFGHDGRGEGTAGSRQGLLVAHDHAAAIAARTRRKRRREMSTKPEQLAVAYLDLGVGGYMDIGTDLTDEALAALPKGRHMLGIVGTYGVDGYVPAQNAPSVLEGYKLVPIEPTPTMITAALESSHAINAHRAEHCYRAMLAAAPEAKL